VLDGNVDGVKHTMLITCSKEGPALRIAKVCLEHLWEGASWDKVELLRDEMYTLYPEVDDMNTGPDGTAAGESDARPPWLTPTGRINWHPNPEAVARRHGLRVCYLAPKKAKAMKAQKAMTNEESKQLEGHESKKGHEDDE
jgi:hypothetical protein